MSGSAPNWPDDEFLLNFSNAWNWWRERSQERAGEEASQHILDVWTSRGRAQECMKKAFAKEIRSAGTRKYIKLAVLSFLGRLLSLSGPAKPIEVVKHCMWFLKDTFATRLSHCPDEVKEAFQELRALLEKYQPEEADQLLESAFFLHFICPAVILPYEWDLVGEAPQPEQMQYMILAAKFLQCAANGTNFPGDDPQIAASLIEAREQMKSSLHGWLSNLPSEPTSPVMSPQTPHKGTGGSPTTSESIPPSVPEPAEPADSHPTGTKSREGSISKRTSKSIGNSGSNSSVRRRHSDAHNRAIQHTQSEKRIAHHDLHHHHSVSTMAAPDEVGRTGSPSKKSIGSVRKAESFNLRRPKQQHDDDSTGHGSTMSTPAGSGTVTPVNTPLDSDLAGSEDDSELSAAASPPVAQSPSKKRPSLLQALRHTASKRRTGPVETGAHDTDPIDSPQAAYKPNRSEYQSVGVELKSETKARSLVNLAGESSLFGDLLYTQNYTLVVFLRSLLSAENSVRRVVNQLTDSCHDILMANRVRVILVAYGHSAAALELQGKLPAGASIWLDRKKILYDTFGCKRMAGHESSHSHHSTPRSRSVDDHHSAIGSSPGSGSGASSSMNPPATVIQLGGAFVFAKHQLINQYVEGKSDDHYNLHHLLTLALQAGTSAAAVLSPHLPSSHSPTHSISMSDSNKDLPDYIPSSSVPTTSSMSSGGVKFEETTVTIGADTTEPTERLKDSVGESRTRHSGSSSGSKRKSLSLKKNSSGNLKHNN